MIQFLIAFRTSSKYGRPIDTTQGVDPDIVNIGAIIGFILVVMAIVLVYKRQKKKQKPKGYNKWDADIPFQNNENNDIDRHIN